MKKVDRNSPVPLYYQLKDIIAELIENEELHPNDPIPPERELCEYHNVSRMTVNKAIIHLVNEGLLYREQGRGTFVAQAKEKHQLSQLLGLTEEMRRRGLQVTTKLLYFGQRTATKRMQEDLQLPDKQQIFEIRRLRIVENEPYSLETAYIPVGLCPTLSAQKLENHSMYELLASEYNLEMDHAFQTIEPVIINDYESEILQVKKNSLALMFSRKTFLKDNTPVELTKALYRSDKYKYEVTLQR
ncbi:transcription regulator hth gntr [Lucifera butyrica]|uniref:Transcription regulator hth gntr n=1 Tax=Lucifera butyrica TaxID=1351585 RepID=A0A498R1P0_9FIRM|nr:GntR family transcriptional regulator [Lucifera butyrica]VBB05374.1 transcription regulator hth gntr [Lucifera butyrica]